MRRSVRRNQLSVALFPFLAVLICTMGALIVLLVLMVQQARVHARTIAASDADQAADDAEKVRLQLEEAQWRREMLEQRRAEKAAEISSARARLAHLEEHIERLKKQANDLMDRARKIDEGRQPLESELAATRQELARLQAEIDQKQRALDDQREKLKSQERWYALIPYEGPHGTRRRPIYVECTDAGIVIQPEGVALLADDFSGPLGPGNPLEAAIRAVREHWQRVSGGQFGEPYPLLVVRPSGVVAYNYAREALRSWDSEFGYELVSEDKKLVFGAADPVLAAQLEKTIELARKRQSAMALMMPRRYPGGADLPSFAVDDVPGVDAVRGHGNGAGIGHGPGFGAAPGAGSGGSVAGSGSQPGPFASQHGNRGTPNSMGPAAGSGTTPSIATNTQANGGQRSSGASSQGTAAAATQNHAGSAPAGPGGSAFGSPIGNIAGPSLGSPAGMSGGSSATSDSGEATSAASSGGGTSSSRRGRYGSNWALQGANPRSTAVTRPIHLAVLSDRIVIVPERGTDRDPVHIRIAPEMTTQDMDRFVAAIQEEMKSWGLAVAGGYWKPVLQTAVAPDAEHHFATLAQALEGSGFEIERKQP